MYRERQAPLSIRKNGAAGPPQEEAIAGGASQNVTGRSGCRRKVRFAFQKASAITR
jgi:hypothetical protein